MMVSAAALSLALLHGEVDFSWTQWSFYTDFLIGWFLFGLAYVLAAGPLRHKFPGSEAVPTNKILWFAAGMLVMLVSLQGPLHDLSDYYLFSAHMVQHLLIMLVMPPLLLLGIPGWMLRPLVRVRSLYAVAWFLTFPLIAFFLNNGIFLLWHFPGPYDLMMRNHDVHVLMHLMIMFSGMLMWWPVLSPLPELPRIAPTLQMLYLFVLGVPMMVAAAMITFSGSPLYTFYVEAPRVFNLTALEDQQLGGAIMWVPGALVIWIAITLVYYHWSQRDGADDQAAETGRVMVTRSGMVLAPPPFPDQR
jgi:putative membrane protein